MNLGAIFGPVGRNGLTITSSCASVKLLLTSGDEEKGHGEGKSHVGGGQQVVAEPDSQNFQNNVDNFSNPHS